MWEFVDFFVIYESNWGVLEFSTVHFVLWEIEISILID